MGGNHPHQSGSQLGKSDVQTGGRAHIYAFPGRTKAEISNTIITGTILVCDLMTAILFDLGSTFSSVSANFTVGLDIVCDLLDF